MGQFSFAFDGAVGHAQNLIDRSLVFLPIMQGFVEQDAELEQRCNFCVTLLS